MSPLPLLPTQTPPLPSLPFSPSSFSSPSHAHPLTLYPPPSPPIAIFILRPPAYTFIHNWCMEESLFDTLVVHVWISVTMSGVLFFFSHMCVRACVCVYHPRVFGALGFFFVSISTLPDGSSVQLGWTFRARFPDDYAVGYVAFGKNLTISI